MKIYEKPSVEIKVFEVEDIMRVSTHFVGTDSTSANDATLKAVTGKDNIAGVSFQW